MSNRKLEDKASHNLKRLQ